MKAKKTNVKKIIYTSLIVILAIIFISSLTFGAISAFASETRENIEVWYYGKFDKNISLFKKSIIWLLISSSLLTLSLSFKDFKNKYID